MGKTTFSVEDYHISLRTGCVLEEPLRTLPDYFEPWNRLSGSIGDLMKESRVREEVNKIPVLDYTKLEGYRQKRLAHLQLAFITAGYVWQDGDIGVVKVLPKAIAVPFHHLSKELGIHPILCHMDAVLANYTLADPKGYYDDLSNIDCLYCLPGGEEGKWFATVTMLVEFEFARCLQPLEKVVNLVNDWGSKKDELWQYYNMQDIVGHLEYMCECIDSIKKALGRMHDKLSAKTFFNVVRPFLGGWGGEGNALPDGLIYEGVSEEPIKLAGGSAAQSTSFQALDAFFGVCHTGERKEFLLQMRQCMPSDHVRFLEDLEKKFSLLSYVEEMNVPKLTSAYNKCISALSDFRSYHISIVTKYVITAAKTSNEDKFESLNEKGTGGSDLIPFLKGLLHTTQRNVKPSRTELMPGGKGDSPDKPTSPGRNVNVLLGLAGAGLLLFGLYKKTVN